MSYLKRFRNPRCTGQQASPAQRTIDVEVEAIEVSMVVVEELFVTAMKDLEDYVIYVR
jgi:hypothetical protein